MLNVFGSVEGMWMLERQREGVAKAQSEGKYKGRKPTARGKADVTDSTQRARRAGHCGSTWRKCA
jgi:DNA invertase Pin-like site-specific DNA recombinase